MNYDLLAKANLPAYPNERHDGLTKRELFAAMAMQTLVKSAPPLADETYFANRAVFAVMAADALLVELNTP